MVPFEICCLGFLDLNFVFVCTEIMISEFYLEVQHESLTIRVYTDAFS